MLSYKMDIFILLATMMATVTFVLILNRIWKSEYRKDHNDLIGWQLGTLGTTYAVILGFMLYTVWTNFCAADLNCDLEANSLRNLYRVADGLPAAQHDALQQECRRYAEAVIRHDWDDMSAGHIPEQSYHLNQDMWKTVLSVRLATPTEILAEDHAITELSNLTEHRRTRLLESQSRIPGVLWWVLIVGGVVTVASTCLFSASNQRLHAFLVFSFALLVTLVLLAVADINRPFQGAVHVTDYAFIRASIDMAN